MTLDRRSFFAASAGLSLLPLAAHAQDDAAEKRLREDWAWLGRYASDNARLKASGEAVGIVFMGDSITEGWRDKRPGFFANGRVCRGIGGQTTPQMLLRMMADVVALRPRAVHIMAGTNDIAGNTGPMTRQQTYDNLTAMTQIAQANGLDVILASVPPAASFPWRPGLETIAPIAEINAWIEAFADEAGAIWVDYGPALGDGKGAIRAGLANDGVHPEAAGYSEMEKVVDPILRRMQV
ncbi:GDSL-type esterase/lipase family protein [Sphingomonas japonica]|uniref:Lysophospholipase L1-like esterase n=1 Tax=Sphingomonas japonica TaxID=511662 RepID=A0ABX0TX45_9SPHN|nr:GDSL-type esterase/lipase family protein [Sphingomonas japonica]NIJ22876.1 lysophospholipase L1-like esterase [Sphingomonas japonica]